MTKFKDVANLYIGCKFKVIRNQALGYFGDCFFNDGRIVIGDPLSMQEYDTDEIVPILRPINSLNPVEKKILSQYYKGTEPIPVEGFEFYSIHVNSARGFAYLLSIKADLFRLIESGEALDATKLNPNPYE